MCGRFANGLSYDEFSQAIDTLLPPALRDDDDSADQYYPTFNVAPGTRYPVVRAKEHNSMLVETMRWGIPLDKLAPSSREDRMDGHRVINSRVDTLMQSKSVWRKLLTSHRCIVFCQGFYEWQKVPIPGESNVRRVPHFVGMSASGEGRTDSSGKHKQLMPMAGLWADIDEGGQKERVFTILTTQSNKQLDFLHDRMPVILPDADAMTLWLGVSIVKQEGPPSLDQLVPLLKPYTHPLECYVVPKEVGRVGTSNENFIFPVEHRKDGILAMFQSAKVKQEKDSLEASVKHEDSSALPKQEPGKGEPANPPAVKQEPSSSPAKHEPHLHEHTTPTKRGPNPPATPSPRKRAKPSPKKAHGTPSLESFWN